MSAAPNPGVALRIAFMGTPAFAVPSLLGLLSLDTIAGRPVRVVAVVTQPDRPAGRGGRVAAGPVKEAALAAGVSVLQPERLRRPENVAALAEYAPDLIVVAAFAQILSRPVLALPPLGCLNVHASLLPRWRGAAPINAAILAGDVETGVTIMKMDPGLDTGPMLTRRALPIRDDDTAGTLTPRLADLGAALLLETVGPWVEGVLTPQSQDEDLATATGLLTREDGRIDWSARDAASIARMVRAYDPWPGTFTHLDGAVLKIKAVIALDGSTISPVDAPSAGAPDSLVPGYVLTREEVTPLMERHGLRWPCLLVVAAENTIVRVTVVQPEGKKAMSAADYLHGQPSIVGTMLG